jgi:hypothetical protein
MILIRDAAAVNHPVLGIAALGSAVVQNTARDKWIGWEPDLLISRYLEGNLPTLPRWLLATLERGLETIYLDDFIAKRDISYRDLLEPSEAAISNLEALSKDARQQHQRGAPLQHKRAVKDSSSDEFWRAEAETELFRSKRAALLATLLKARRVLSNRNPDEAFRELLRTSSGKQVVASLVRKAKSETVGTSIADITVCGAVAPYSHLVGGKLVAMLLTSPEVVAAYRHRYAEYTSIIASSMAGRAIKKPPILTILATTSLYGIPLSQYTRIAIPAGVVGGSNADVVRYEKLGQTRGYGSFHFSVGTRQALSTLCAQSSNGATVNFIFGEGVSPTFRAIRDGLDELGLASDELLNHGSPKIAYGVRLASNSLEYLLGVDDAPRYYFPEASSVTAQTEQIARWWVERWLAKRIQRDDVLSAVAGETLIHPIRHRARVSLPKLSSEQMSLFPP